jgi:hypothetical protein
VYDIKAKTYTGIFFRHRVTDGMIVNTDFKPKVKDPVIVDNINKIGETIQDKFDQHVQENP